MLDFLAYMTVARDILLVVFLILLLVVTPHTTIAGIASSGQSSGISLEIPSEVPAGEQFTTSVTIQPKSRSGEFETPVTVILYVDGEQIDRQKVTVGDGETAGMTFDHVIDEPGEHTIRVVGKGTFGPFTFRESVSKQISVTKLTTEISTPDTVTEYSGAAFSIPQSLEDEVEQYREQVGGALAPQAFVLATESDLYLVFTQTEPKTGEVTVRGKSLKSDVTASGMTFGVITSSEVEFETRGE